LDAVIVGARCAGAATAMLLARAGARVVLIDKGQYGSDTTSTHALMRAGVVQLQRWGVLPAILAAGTPAVSATTFGYPSGDVTVSIEPKFGVDALYAPRRTVLDRVLVDAARAAGAEVLFGARVDDLLRGDGGRVDGVVVAVDGVRRELRADIVIGADGLYSTVARLVDAPVKFEGRHAVATLYSYWTGLPNRGYRWRFGARTGAGVIPTNDGASCVFASVPMERFRDEVRGDPPAAFRRVIHLVSADLSAELDAAVQVGTVRGFGGHRGFIRTSTGPGWALVGDAGYFKDPITAHGITDALRDAELLARAILRAAPGALADFEAMRDDVCHRLFEVTDEIASLAATDDELQTLHRALSHEMSRESRLVAELEPLTAPSPLASASAAIH
jgi:2-polyprenyl-6-methoxyphenol hydroxylase-like FAD-dependent oxidoreductase